MKRKNIAGFMDFVDTGNWNVAQSYAQIKIMKQLELIDIYERIAECGTNEFIEEFIIDEQTKNKSKLMGLDHMAFHLMVLIENTDFGLKEKYKIDTDSMYNDIKLLKESIPRARIEKINQRDKKRILTINYEVFNFIFERLRKIKMILNTPLNKSNMIFMNPEDLNEDELKEKYIDEIMSGG